MPWLRSWTGRDASRAPRSSLSQDSAPFHPHDACPAPAGSELMRACTGTHICAHTRTYALVGLYTHTHTCGRTLMHTQHLHSLTNIGKTKMKHLTSPNREGGRSAAPLVSGCSVPHRPGGAAPCEDHFPRLWVEEPLLSPGAVTVTVVGDVLQATGARVGGNGAGSREEAACGPRGRQPCPGDSQAKAMRQEGLPGPAWGTLLPSLGSPPGHSIRDQDMGNSTLDWEVFSSKLRLELHVCYGSPCSGWKAAPAAVGCRGNGDTLSPGPQTPSLSQTWLAGFPKVLK